MNYSQDTVLKNPNSFEVFSQPRYLLGKTKGPLIQFYTLDLTESGSLKVSSPTPRTVPLAVFGANFSKVADVRVGGIYIKTPTPAMALRVSQNGTVSTRNVETGAIENYKVSAGDVIVTRPSGMMSVMDYRDFSSKYTTTDPLKQVPPPLGRDNLVEPEVK